MKNEFMKKESEGCLKCGGTYGGLWIAGRKTDAAKQRKTETKLTKCNGRSKVIIVRKERAGAPQKDRWAAFGEWTGL